MVRILSNVDKFETNINDDTKIKIDLIGERFGKLVAVKRIIKLRPNSKIKIICYLCKCDCGNEVLYPMIYLRSGNRKDCGCVKPIVRHNLKLKTKYGEKDHANEYTQKYRRTELGHLRNLYQRMATRSKEKGFGNLPFTSNDFVNKYSKHFDYFKLFKAYKDSGFKKDFAPSIDRINPKLGYFFDNMELVSWKENKEKSIEEINTLATSKLTSIHNDGTDYLNNMVHIHGLIDDKITQFNSDVDAGGYIKDTDTTDWQKSKMTDDEGNSIYLDTIDFMNIENTITKSGLYYVADSTNGIDGENTNGLIRAHFRNVDNGVIEFSPTDSHNVYYLQKYSGIWDTFTKVVKTTPGFKAESEIGAQNKADIAFNNAKSYVDDELTTRRKILWSGNASEKGTVLSLTDSYKNYSSILIGYVTLAGHKTYESLIFSTTSVFPIQDFNLGNADGGAARFYESGLRAYTNTEFTITHNHTYIPESNTGAANSNPVEFIMIVGVK